MNKINASLATGGPTVMLQTIADVTGVNLDGYVLTGFTGFQEMVGNVLGGVQIELTDAVTDRSAGADLEAGSQYLNGPDALALARARKTLSGGDLTRQLNGGMVLLAALASVQAYGPLHLPTLLSESYQWMTTDLDPGDLLAFSALALDTPIEQIGSSTSQTPRPLSSSTSPMEASAHEAPLLVTVGPPPRWRTVTRRAVTRRGASPPAGDELEEFGLRQGIGDIGHGGPSALGVGDPVRHAFEIRGVVRVGRDHQLDPGSHGPPDHLR
jgi:LCP family protein required for cell wall assembly